MLMESENKHLESPHVRSREEVEAIAANTERLENAKRLVARLGGLGIEAAKDTEPEPVGHELKDRLDGSS